MFTFAEYHLAVAGSTLLPFGAGEMLWSATEVADVLAELGQPEEEVGEASLE